MSQVSAHFVTFYSPGTFVAETTRMPIDSWDVEQAKQTASSIVERHGATPYGFKFTTRSRDEGDLDSRQIAESSMYYLGGTVQTLAEIKAKNDPADRILISNMEGNGWDRVITNNNSWQWTQPLQADDVVLEWTPPERQKKEEKGDAT